MRRCPRRDRAKIEAQVNKLKEAMQVEDTGRIRTQIAELQRAMMVLSQVMYNNATQTESRRPWAERRQKAQ